MAVLYKRSLSARKGLITKAINECEDALQITPLNVSILKDKLRTLESKWDPYQEVYYKHTLALDEAKKSDAELAREETEFLAQQTIFHEAVGKYRAVIDSTPPPQPNQPGQPTPESLVHKLPTLQSPSFNGETLEFEAFWDQFEAQIGKRSDLSKVSKLQYLKTCLKGSATELIKSFASTDDNYDEAVSILKSRYADTEKTRRAILHKIFDLQPPTVDRGSLDCFLISLENLSKSLKVKHDYSQSEWIIADVFQRKLPKEVQKELHYKYGKNYYSLQEMSEGLTTIISHMEVGTSSKPVKQNEKSRTQHQSNQSHKSEAANSSAVGTYYNSIQSQPQKFQRSCRLCGYSHRESRCEKYPTVVAKKQRLKALNRCVSCFGPHPASECPTKLNTCRHCNEGVHHVALCPLGDSPEDTSKKKENAQNTKSSNKPMISVSHCGILSCSTNTNSTAAALPTAIAEVVMGKRSFMVRIFFDQGAQRTFVARSLVNKLQLKVQDQVYLKLSGFITTSDYQYYDVVKLVIKMGKRRKRVTTIVQEHLPTHIYTKGLTKVVKHLQECQIPIADPQISDDTVGPVDILMGADYYQNFIHPLTIQREGVYLLQSPVGHLVTGTIPAGYLEDVSGPTTVETVSIMRVTDELNPLQLDSHIEEQLHPVAKLWELDTIGIDVTKPAPDDSRSYEQYLDTVEYKDGQYWVRLPWKLDRPDLPTNFKPAFGQMKSLVHELERKPGHLELYHKIIKEHLESQFIEEVPTCGPRDLCHYLPHHAVVKDSPTTPLRIVFNCSARESRNAPCLNDCLMTGPSLTEKLGDVVLKFRTNLYAYTADISKAFLRVGLQESDRNFTRFLWPENPHDPSSSILTYRFKSVLFGATSSPFLLQATMDFHLRKSTSPLRDEIAQNFYVDNFQGTTSDQDTLFQIYREANCEMSVANMPLRQWSTNNRDLKEKIERDFPNYEVPSSTTVLGLKWNLSSDEISLKQVSYNEGKLTKRTLLSQVSQVFDPLGLFSPITILGKMLIQRAWKLKLEWDASLPSDIVESWREIALEFQQLSTLPLPRIIGIESESCDLHIFCDASSLAYGAVAYLVSNNSSKLITSKARVTPIKSRTLPQLELTALYIGCKLGVYINKTLSNLVIERTCIWSDNEAALQWIKNNQSKITYVQNRVAEIREMQTNFAFLHVPTNANPADLLSRGMTVDKLRGSSLWFSGPEWLPTPNAWPEQKEYVVILQEVVTAENERPSLPIDCNNYSSLKKLLQVTSFVFKFIQTLCKHEMPDPLQYWVKVVQEEAYALELAVLKGSDASTCAKRKVPKLIQDLGLYLDTTGMIRCRGRVQNSTLELSAKHPILIPKHSWFTHLVIQQAHLRVLHGGVADTLTHIRQRFWIPQGRQAVKTSIRACTICKRFDARPLNYPNPPPLPVERVHEAMPFEVTGVDYTGAITLTNTPDSIPRKVYVCLFTCATTRAVHLELAIDLTAETFLRVFRRFVARRSCPRLLISDNGTNFQSSAAYLQQFFENPRVKAHFADSRCTWKFIPPRAPWFGGFYERMIGIVKKCLRKVLLNTKVNFDELHTVLVEIENRVNNRPLTYVGDDQIESLTPSHLLYGRRLEPVPSIECGDLIEDPTYQETCYLQERFDRLSKILNKWNRSWKNEYLTSLREYHTKAGQPEASVLPLKPGDVVLVECEGSRSIWPLGKVISVHPDSNGTLRVVKVLSKGIISLRTIEKLIPLEISSLESVDPEVIVPNPGETVRPQRRTALQSRSQLRALINEGTV